VTTTELNLLPVPRIIDLGTSRVAWREPVVVHDGGLPPQGYRLRMDEAAVTIDASDHDGAFYARATLGQLRHTHGGDLPIGTITDWPDLPVRGVLLDVSRDKVPTIATLTALVDRLASWKINQIQLYIEHTFAYRDHEDVWRDADPLTPDDIRALDDHCRARHVELVPDQNCLGHMDRWLRHPRYAPLAISPDGYVQYGIRRPASTIDPVDPASLELIRSLLAELLPNFTSRRVHVGLDEPWELSADRFDDYFAWLRALRALPELDGREMLVWGDVLANHPGAIADVPDGVTVCDWGYEEDSPFDAHGTVFAGSGRPFWTCPGTSSWTSILGRVPNMRNNCVSAAVAARDHGAGGMLTTDWGDLGHLQYLPVSEPGFAEAAAVSWGLQANRDLDVASALSCHCYDDPTGELGAALVVLGGVSQIPHMQVPNMSSLTLPLYFPMFDLNGGERAAFSRDDVDAVLEALDAGERHLAGAAARRDDADLVVAELENGVALVRLLAHDARAHAAPDGSTAAHTDSDRRGLVEMLDPIMARHRDLWLARNRPGGLADSERWLSHLRQSYVDPDGDRVWPGSGV